MAEVAGYHLTASGMVQGVGYRYHCMEAARALKLKGYVMNLPDGDVEIEVFGAMDGLKKFMSEITRGDSVFRVTELKVDEILTEKGYKDFTIRFY
jgi:acylphosphatase